MSRRPEDMRSAQGLLAAPEHNPADAHAYPANWRI